MSKQPRPAYHRRSDLRRLQEFARATPLIISDNGRAYEARLVSGGHVLLHGRHEVIHAYITGFNDACFWLEATKGACQ